MMTHSKPVFRALVVGFYGAPNVGDEVLLDLLVRRIRELGGEPVVASIDPLLTRRMHGVDAVQFANVGDIARALMHCDVLVMGGGGIFQDHHPFNLDAVYLPYANDISSYARPMLLARQLGVPTIVWGQGVGPLSSAGARTLVRELFQHAVAVSVRDESSKALLRQIGVDRGILVAADPGWLFRRYHPLPAQQAAQGAGQAQSKVLAVVVREWDKGQWKTSLVEALRAAVPEGWRIQWVAFQAHTDGSGATSDLPLIESLRQQLPGRSNDELIAPATMDATWETITRADAVLSMRLHASILALLAGKPTAGLEYDDKLSHAHAMAEMPAILRLSTDDGPERFVEAIQSLVAEAWRPDPQVVDGLEASASAHLRLLDSCTSLPPTPLRFDAASTDWLSLWLQQALVELELTREQSQRAHELLLFRDHQLAEQKTQNTNLTQQLVEKQTKMNEDMVRLDAAQGQLQESAKALQQIKQESAQALQQIKQENAQALEQIKQESAQALQQIQQQLADKQAYIDDKEVYIAILQQQIEQMQTELARSRQETADALNLWRRLSRFLQLLRRDLVRVLAAPFKLASVWRRHGLKVALQQIPRRMKTLGVPQTAAMQQMAEPPPSMVRPVRLERLLVIAGTLTTDGWPNRAMQFAKAGDRAGFFVRITAADGSAWPDDGSGMPARLAVDAHNWLQEVRAENTRVLLADGSPQALGLARSARERGAEVIVDLAALGTDSLSAELRVLTDRVVTGTPEQKVDGVPSRFLGTAGDNEIFDSYRSHELPQAYEDGRQHVLFVVLGGDGDAWLDAALEASPDLVFHVTGMKVDGRDTRQVHALDWSWQPQQMAPLIAGAHAVVIVGGAGDSTRLADLSMAALLLEKPVFVDALPSFAPSPNLHRVDVAKLSAQLAGATASEDYAFIARHAWLGHVEQLMQPEYPVSVSVVVLIHNNRRIIERCVSTLLEHAGEWLQEIVVVDNQSSDGGAELVESLYAGHAKVKLVRNSENGCSSGRNLGVKHSTGSYIAFFDSDQWLTSPSCFSEAVNILAANPGVGTIGWNAGWFDGTRDDLGGPISDYLPNRGMNNEARIKGYRDDVGFLGTSCMFIARDLFERLEGFDVFYDPTCFEDTDICFQVKKAGYSVAFRDLAGVRHQPHQTTGASEGSERYKRLFNRNATYFRDKWKGYPEFFVDLKSWH
ncbi:polysaccharide pyruvyl transferase family protein [Stenotrophomonas sp. HMSC10F06]|uniref:polysaccharide pyruvyl transferase family protein n=1 Tax=Stenotrophomonas sp. HMSC10F06 TaxID=1581081 RepID=UPI0009F39691|nr:polysaccharide pyruvyl transferase family protein [Stenotrophomonas sp. HMSC10F06]